MSSREGRGKEKKKKALCQKEEKIVRSRVRCDVWSCSSLLMKRLSLQSRLPLKWKHRHRAQPDQSCYTSGSLYLSLDNSAWEESMMGVTEPMTEKPGKGGWGNANFQTRKGMSAHQGHSTVFTVLTLLQSHYVSLKTNQHRTITNKSIHIH